MKKKDLRNTLSLVFALLQEAGKLLMDLESVAPNRNSSLTWGVNSPRQMPTDMERAVDKVIPSVSFICQDLPGHQVLDHIHVFISIARESSFQVDHSLLLVESN